MINRIARHIDVQTAYTALSSDAIRATGMLSAPLSNVAIVYMSGDTGDDVEIHPGEWFRLDDVDLSTVTVKGASGDILTFVGGN